ncbi:MAG: hypothetical protein KDD34_09420 [Bdellovibrionales bacterium]|nr:hypothetical protein [Bdellovibrionales bacterium]
MSRSQKKISLILWGLALAVPLTYNSCGKPFSSVQDGVESASSASQGELPPPDSNNPGDPSQNGDGLTIPSPAPPPPPTVTITPIPPPSPPPPTPAPQKSVTVAVGTGGLIMTTSDGFLSKDYKNFDVPGTLNLLTPPNCGDPTAVVINNECCYQDQWSCYAGNGHSDFHLRSIAYGNKTFVAVGGAGFGISRTSVDAIHWSNRSLWINGNNFILSGKKNPSFITSVVFVKGEFIAMAGFGAYLYNSSDGLTWTNQSLNIGGVFGYLTYTGKGFFATGQAGAWAFSSNGKTWDVNSNHAHGLRFFDPATNGSILLVREVFTNGQTGFLIKPADNSGAWVVGQSLPSDIKKLIYSSQSKKFHAYAAGKVYLSNDGMQWTAQNLNVNVAFQSVDYADRFYIAQSYNWQTAESKLYQSLDGIIWTFIPDDGPGNGQNIFQIYQTYVSP